MKVLLVDDSKSARYALRSMLGKKGLDVIMAESGEEALDVLGDNKVDLVLMDQSMPGMGGLEATRQIKSDAAMADLPVVLCTSNEGEAFQREAEEAGVLTILAKPPQPARLQEVLDTVRQKTAGQVVEPEAEAAVASAPFDTTEIKRQLEIDLGLWMQESISNGLDGVKTELGSVAARLSALEARHGSLRTSLDSLPDVGSLKQEFGVLVDQQVKGLADDVRGLRENLREQNGELESLGASVREIPSGDEITRASDDLRMSLNQQIAEIKDRQNGLVNEVSARARAEAEAVEQRVMRKVYTLVGTVFVILAGAIVAARVLL